MASWAKAVAVAADTLMANRLAQNRADPFLFNIVAHSLSYYYVLCCLGNVFLLSDETLVTSRWEYRLRVDAMAASIYIVLPQAFHSTQP